MNSHSLHRRTCSGNCRGATNVVKDVRTGVDQDMIPQTFFASLEVTNLSFPSCHEPDFEFSALVVLFNELYVACSESIFGSGCCKQNRYPAKSGLKVPNIRASQSIRESNWILDIKGPQLA